MDSVKKLAKGQRQNAIPLCMELDSLYGVWQP